MLNPNTFKQLATNLVVFNHIVVRVVLCVGIKARSLITDL